MHLQALKKPDQLLLGGCELLIRQIGQADGGGDGGKDIHDRDVGVVG